MVLVREDMTVPDITPGFVEGHLDARDLAGQRHHHVAAVSFGGTRFACIPVECDGSQPITAICDRAYGRDHVLWDEVGSETFAVNHLEVHQMHMDRVGVASGVVDLPDLGPVQVRILRIGLGEGHCTVH